jgi:ABC-type uncharacterized transport system substrate-binding protein
MQFRCVLALIAFGLLFQQSAAAHPHVWIEAKSDLVFDAQGRVVAIDHDWTLDEMYTEAAVDGLDFWAWLFRLLPLPAREKSGRDVSQ